MDPTHGFHVEMDSTSNVVTPRTEGTPMKHLISCSSLCVAATLTIGFGGLAGCEGSDNADVSGHVRQHDANAPKIDPNAGASLEAQEGG